MPPTPALTRGFRRVSGSRLGTWPTCAPPPQAPLWLWAPPESSPPLGVWSAPGPRPPETQLYAQPLPARLGVRPLPARDPEPVSWTDRAASQGPQGAVEAAVLGGGLRASPVPAGASGVAPAPRDLLLPREPPQFPARPQTVPRTPPLRSGQTHVSMTTQTLRTTEEHRGCRPRTGGGRGAHTSEELSGSGACGSWSGRERG